MNVAIIKCDYTYFLMFFFYLTKAYVITNTRTLLLSRYSAFYKSLLFPWLQIIHKLRVECRSGDKEYIFFQLINWIYSNLAKTKPTHLKYIWKCNFKQHWPGFTMARIGQSDVIKVSRKSTINITIKSIRALTVLSMHNLM